jgi:hypothetical protein
VLFVGIAGLTVAKARLGIDAGVYHAYRPAYLLQHLDEYALCLRRTIAVLLGRVDLPVFAPWPCLPLLAMVPTAIVRLLDREGRRRILVPAGIVGFFVIVPSIYVFTNTASYSPLSLIDVSWNRLLVGPVLAAVVYVVDELTLQPRDTPT